LRARGPLHRRDLKPAQSSDRTPRRRVGRLSKRYRLKRLVWYRAYGAAIDAISFEKQLKRWRREWKFRLVEEMNPGWADLWPELMGLDMIGPLSHLQGR